MFQLFNCVVKRSISSQRLTFSEFGDPIYVVKSKSVDIGDIKPDEVVVKVLASPIHPSEINTIQGQYPIKPPFPAFPGNEAVGSVDSVGKNVKDLAIGDLVSPVVLGLGTWSSHIKSSYKNFYKIPSKIDPIVASTAFTNPGTAYRMLQSFIKLQKGDYVIQNGSTSSVGIYVMQIAKLLGIETSKIDILILVNIFRERETPEGTEKTRDVLHSYGGSLVLTDSEFKEKLSQKEIPHASLALTCLAGPTILPFLRCLKSSSSIVVYGGMTRKPMAVPVGPLIFKDIKIRGFWFTSWMNEIGPHSYEAIQIRQMLLDWFSSGKLKASPIKTYEFNNWKEALDKSAFVDRTPSGISRKPLLKMY